MCLLSSFSLCVALVFEVLFLCSQWKGLFVTSVPGGHCPYLGVFTLGSFERGARQMLRKMTVHCVSVQPLLIVFTHVCLCSGPRADFTGRAARFHDSQGPNRKHTCREGKRAVLHTTVQVVPGTAAGHCGLCCLGVPLSAKQTVWKWRDNNVCMLIHSRRHISHMKVLSWHKQLYSYQGWFTWQLDLARFMWPVPGVQLWVDLKDASVKTDLFWCLVNIAALLCGCFVCCLDFLYLCMSYDSGIWVRRTKTSVNINISSAVLYFWSVLTALSFSHSSPLWAWTCFITRSSSIINSCVLVPVRRIQTRPSEGALWKAADHSVSLPNEPPSLTSLWWWCVLTGTPSANNRYCRYKLQQRENSKLFSHYFSVTD